MDDWKMIHFQLGRLGLLSPAMLVSGSATYRYFLILHFVCSTKNVGSGPIPPSTGGLVDVGMWQWAAWQFLLIFQRVSHQNYSEVSLRICFLVTSSNMWKKPILGQFFTLKRSQLRTTKRLWRSLIWIAAAARVGGGAFDVRDDIVVWGCFGDIRKQTQMINVRYIYLPF